MKKISILLSFMFLAFASNAQITLTSASFPVLGDSLINGNDSLAIGISVGTAGANQTWNFATMANHYQDTSIIVSASSTPFPTSFPSASLALSSGGSFAYLQKTATTTDIVGIAGNFVGPMPMAINYTTPETVAKSGMTYMSNYTANGAYFIQLSGAAVGQATLDSVRLNVSNVITNNFDSWGSVTTPNGTFPCLRNSQLTVSTNVVDVKIPFIGWQYNVNSTTNSNQVYLYMDDNSVNPVAQVNMDSTSATVNNASYRLINLNPPYGINTIQTPSLFRVFPNPATSSNINLLVGGLKAANYTVQISNIAGQIQASKLVFVEEAKTTAIDLSAYNLTVGSYFATVYAPNQAALKTIKFEVIK
jgi:hypothetical protein